MCVVIDCLTSEIPDTKMYIYIFFVCVMPFSNVDAWINNSYLSNINLPSDSVLLIYESIVVLLHKRVFFIIIWYFMISYLLYNLLCSIKYSVQYVIKYLPSVTTVSSSFKSTSVLPFISDFTKLFECIHTIFLELLLLFYKYNKQTKNVNIPI